MRKAVALGSFVSLLVAAFMPLQAAVAMPPFQPTFTDTVSVTDYLGHPLAGASVALVGIDDVTQKESLSTVSLTNEMGIAHVVGNSLAGLYGIAVTPPVDDTVNAATTYTENIWLRNFDRTIAIQLTRATARVHVQNADGSDTPAGAMLNYPNAGQTDPTGYLVIARAGVVGIDLTDQLALGQNSSLEVFQSAAANAVMNTLQVGVAGKGVGSVAALGTAADPSIGLPVDGSGATILKFSVIQVHGQLTNGSGNPVALPSGATLTVRTLSANVDGSPNYINDTTYYESYTRVVADGSFGINLRDLAPGKYFPNFSSTGSATLGSFVGAPFWILPNGNISETADGTGESAASFVSQQPVPAGTPNLVFKTLASDGLTPAPARYNIEDMSKTNQWGSNGASIFAEWTSSGIASAYLAPGSYVVTEDPSDKRMQFFAFNLTVNQDGSISATNQNDGSAISLVNGAVEHRFNVANLFVKIVDPGTNNIANSQGCANVVLQTGGPGQGSCAPWSWLGLANLYVTDGVWDLWVNSMDGVHADAHYNLSVTGPDMSVTNSAGTVLNPIDGVYNLPLASVNFSAHLLVNGQPSFSAGVDLQTLDSQGNVVTSTGLNVNNSNVAVNLNPGSYKLIVHPNNPSMADRPYLATVALDGTVSITGETADSQGYFTLTGSIPNVTGAVVDPSGNPLSLLQGEIVFACLAKLQPEGYFQNDSCSQVSGAFAFNAPTDGTYRIHLQVGGSSRLGEADSTEFNIDAQHPTVDVGNVALTTVNFNVRFQLGGAPATSPSLEVQVLDTNGNTTSGFGFGFGASEAHLHLNPGSYKLIYHTGDATWADHTYLATVAQDGTVTVTGEAPDNLGYFTLTGATANVTATIVDPQGNPLNLPNNVGVNVCLAKQDSNGNWGWSSCSNYRSGQIALKTLTDGTYRLHIDVYGTSDYANSDTASFTIDSQHPTADLGSIRLATPNVKLNFVLNGQPATQGWLEVQKDLGSGNFEWVEGRGFNGSIAESLAPGAYKLVYHTNSASMADRAYAAVVAQDLSVTILGVTSESDGSFTLTGLVPNVVGSVVDAAGHAIVLGPNQWMTAFLQKKDQNGNWQFQGNSGLQNGHFLFNTSSNGTYRVRIEPNGLSDVAATNLPEFTIDDTNTNFDYHLARMASPNLKVAFAAQGVSNPNGWIQFEQLQTNGNYQWFSSRGFNGQIAENLPAGTYKVTVHINNVNLADGIYQLTVANDGSVFIAGNSPDVNGVYTLTGATPNVTGYVLDSAGNPIVPANGKWVNACLQKQDTYGNWNWQSCSGLNSGTFAFRVSTDGTYRVHLDVQGYTGSTATDLPAFIITGGAAAQDYGTVRLSAPNLQAHLVFGGQPLTGAYLEVQQSDGNGGYRWVNNASSGSGNVSLNLAPGVYRALLHTNSSVAADRYFAITVGNDSSVSITGETIGGDGYFNLNAATPNVTVSVKDANGGALPQWSFGAVLQKRNAWGGWDWLNWYNADSAGNVAISITDSGTYRFRIEPRNVSGAAVTASAPFTIAAPTDTANLGEVRLKAPNVQFVLHDPNGSPVANANVSLQFGNWWTNATTGQDGRVALFVDSADIAASNPWATGTVHLHVSVDAPWDRSDIARFECNSGDQKPLCANLPDLTIGTDYTSVNLPDVSYAAPNVRIQVLTPAGAVEAPGSWVVLWKLVCDTQNPSNCHREWYAGAVTNQSGAAYFNVPDADAGLSFAVEVNPSWQNRSSEAQNLDDNGGLGYSLSQIATKSVALLGSNLKLAVLQATAQDAAAMWTGLGIEQVDSNNNFVQWVAGYGTDNFGKVGIHLNDGRYRINLYPNNGSKGTVTHCVVEVTTGVVSLVDCNGATISGDAVTVKLSLGNLIGQVTDAVSGTAIEGAIVVATNTADQSVMQTVTDANGNYGFQVPNGSTWDLKVIYVNPDPTAQAYDMATSSGVTAPGDGSQTVQNVQLARKA